MQIRSRLAECALGLARWLGASEKGSGPGGRVDPLLDRVEPAEDHALPSTQWLALGDRLRSRSLRVLRAEALYAVAALHHAHEVVAAVLRQRVAQGDDDLDPAQRWGLIERAGEWDRDAATLSHALGLLGPLPVPDATVAAYLQATPEELGAIEEMVERGEAHAHRALVAELLE